MSRISAHFVDPTTFVGGEILYHQTRQHYYQTINRVDIKLEDGGWAFGWSYVRVVDISKKQDKTAFEVDCDPDKFKMFVRQDKLFDADWLLIRKISL